MKENSYVITEGEKRREQSEGRGQRRHKRNTVEEGTGRQSRTCQQRCLPAGHKRDRGATAFLLTSATVPEPRSGTKESRLGGCVVRELELSL